MSGGERIEMMNRKYNQQEINNINEIEQQLNRDSQYITIAIGNSRILRFVTERKIEEVEAGNDQFLLEAATRGVIVTVLAPMNEFI